MYDRFGRTLAYLDKADGWDYSVEAARAGAAHSYVYHGHPSVKQNSIVLCDSDPLKLHYSWCLARIGAAPWSRFQHELRYARRALGAAQLGFADMCPCLDATSPRVA